MGLLEWLLVVLAGCWLGFADKPTLTTLKSFCIAFGIVFAMSLGVDRVFLMMGSFGDSPGSLLQRALFENNTAMTVWFTAWAMAVAVPLYSSRYVYSRYRH